MQYKNLFGTDGIRGPVGEKPVTPEFIMHLGWAIGQELKSVNPSPSTARNRILIGRDTRISGPMLEASLTAGLTAAGVDSITTEILPTPAVAHLVPVLNCCAGIVISASHNSYQDNGVKIFSASGHKLSYMQEKNIILRLQNNLSIVPTKDLGIALLEPDTAERYIDFCKATVTPNCNLSGLHIVLDCAHGACYKIAHAVFTKLGATTDLINIAPDGLNINQNCGTTDPQQLVQRVKKINADFGIAFDGDGDRVVIVDNKGTVLDGDDILMLIATSRHKQGKLKGGLVGTQMTNMGLEWALKRLNIPFIRTPVGDQYVIKGLQKNNWWLGGEPSGHIICRDLTTTGDGIIAALQALAAWLSMDSECTYHRKWNRLPQIIQNVSIADSPVSATNIIQHPQIIMAIDDAKTTLGLPCKVFIRLSGTEPLIRVVVEGENLEQVNKSAQQIVDVITDLLHTN